MIAPSSWDQLVDGIRDAGSLHEYLKRIAWEELKRRFGSDQLLDATQVATDCTDRNRRKLKKKFESGTSRSAADS